MARGPTRNRSGMKRCWTTPKTQSTSFVSDAALGELLAVARAGSGGPRAVARDHAHAMKGAVGSTDDGRERSFRKKPVEDRFARTSFTACYCGWNARPSGAREPRRRDASHGGIPETSWAHGAVLATVPLTVHEERQRRQRFDVSTAVCQSTASVMHAIFRQRQRPSQEKTSRD